MGQLRFVCEIMDFVAHYFSLFTNDFFSLACHMNMYIVLHRVRYIVLLCGIRGKNDKKKEKKAESLVFLVILISKSLTI